VERSIQRRAHAKIWAALACAALICAVAGARASARWRGVDVPSAEPPRTEAPAPPPAAPRDAKFEELVLSVAKDADNLWARDFRRRNKPYAPLDVVLVDTPSRSDCGPGIVLGRPDCFGTNKAYFDLSFQIALEAKYPDEAEGARAYAVAHEVGHHVQRVLGLDKKVDALLADKPVAAHWVEVLLELQADCLAGVWSRRTEQKHLTVPTQIEGSIRKTSELGTARRLVERDDQVRGETYTYAIPRRRIYWFAQGYAHGEIDDCDTFAP
jgi:predicted metalloprotease